jgi:hypothetical protein
MKYDKLLILRKKKSDIYRGFKICTKPKNHIIEIRNLWTKFK